MIYGTHTCRKPKSPQSDGKTPPFTEHHSLADRKSMGKALRDKCLRSAHAEWKPLHNRPDPVSLVLRADEGRLPDLLPLRHGRMAVLSVDVLSANKKLTVVFR